MFDRRLREVMDPAQRLLLPPETTVAEAARQMAQWHVTAAMVVEDGQLTGIFTVTDAVLRVMVPGLDPARVPLSQVMTPSPVTLEPHRPFGYALLLMHERRISRVPVVKDGQVLGIVCARMALDPDMEDFVAEERRREHFAHAH